MGCGTAVATVALHVLKGRGVIPPSVRLQVLDYNETVIREQTLPNLRLNGVDLDAASWGDWKGLGEGYGDDMVVVTCETVYTRAKCEELCELFRRVRPRAVVMAGKRFYFGLDGGVQVFRGMVEEGGWGRVTEVAVWDNGSGNIRECIVVDQIREVEDGKTQRS